VNGEAITYQEWIGAYRNLYEQQQKAQPGQPITAAVNRQIENAAWDQLVMQKLVNQELRRRDIEVSRSELVQAARFAPPAELMQNELFQTNGQFDIDKYHQFLAAQSDNQMLLQLEAYYRDVIPRSKLFYQVTSGTYMTESQMWRLWSDARETARVRYVAIDPETVVPDASVSVTPKEIEAYYKSHQDEFRRPASAVVKYLTLDRSPTAADSAAALNRVREVRQAAATGDFAEVAKAESADSVSGREGGSLGKLRRGQTVPAFEQTAFSLPVGQVSEPVLTQFGYHIIKVESRTGDEPEVRHILIPVGRSPESEERLLDRADSLETLGGDMPIEEVAKRMGLYLRQGDLNDSIPFLPAVGQADDAAQWIFRDAEIGEVSTAFETPQVYYMVELVSKTEAGIVPLSEASPTIERTLKAQRKLEQAAQQSKLVAAEAGPFTRLQFVSGLGRANAAIGTAFGLKPGEVSGVVEAEGALFIIETLEKTEADRKEFDEQKQANRARFTQALAEQRWNQFLEALKESAKIVDNREALRSQSAQANAQ
jgi:peptidyl-prolyl cis-trans isomerase D